jgi:predicted phage terminase large subunit-like protein
MFDMKHSKPLSTNILNRLELVAERTLYKRSFYQFYKVAFCQLHPGTEYDENWHAKYLCEVLQKEAERIRDRKIREKDIIINVPFRSSKSMLTTVIFPIWVWACINPGMKFISVSYSGNLSLEHSRRSRDLINTVWFQRLYGNIVVLKADVAAASHYETLQGGMRKAVGTGGQITGSGADIIIVDDPQNPLKAASETERTNTIEFYDHTLFSRLNEPDIGVRIIVQQRLHQQDLTGHLMDEKHGRPDDHNHICIPGEMDMSVMSPPSLAKYYVDGLFWVSRFSHKVLASYRKALGSLQYSGQIGQRPTPVEGNIWKRKWFNIVEPERVQRDIHKHPIHFFIDTAYTEDETERNDPCGFLAGFIKDEVFYIINFTEAWLEFPDLIKFLKQYVVLHGYTNSSMVYIEPKASGKSVVQMLKQPGVGLNVVEINNDYIRDDKVTRASGVSPVIEAGRCALIAGPWNDKYLAQVTSFPKATHDEAVDVTVYGLNVLGVSDSFFAAFI